MPLLITLLVIYLLSTKSFKAPTAKSKKSEKPTHVDHNRKGLNEFSCLRNRSTIRELFNNNGSHIMNGFVCSSLKGDMVAFKKLRKNSKFNHFLIIKQKESTCRSEQNAQKNFFNDNKVRKRLQSKTIFKSYWSSQTVSK